MITILGLILSMAAIVGGQVLEGGNLQSIIQLTAFIIVTGGTLGAVMVQFPFGVFMAGLKLGIQAFGNHHYDYPGLITQLEGFAQVARKEGILALESRVKEVQNPFLTKGLQYVIDGTEPRLIREILDTEMAFHEEREMLSAKIFEAAGGYAPTIGILGAVLGLIHVMENLADPGKLGSGIAVAFVATIYGVGSANLLWLPIFGNVKIKIRQSAIYKELMIEGLIAIAGGENPRYLREKLEGFLEESQRTKAAA
jgi:chemotaxis protein MotA